MKFAFCCLLLASLAICSSQQVIYEWNSLIFDWKSEEQKQEYLSSGKYVPENCGDFFHK